MKKYDPNRHHRRSIRLKGYDYSQAGLYFVTVVILNREKLLGRIENGKMVFNDAGEMVKNEWLKLPERFPNIKLHEYMIMPNHFHGIIEIVPVGATLVVAPTTLGDIVGAFKSITTVEYIRGVKQNGWDSFHGKLWQRNYWEHIIRNENEYNRIAQYIIDNPNPSLTC